MLSAPCGNGEIGRRTKFRVWHFGVRVQVPFSAPFLMSCMSKENLIKTAESRFDAALLQSLEEGYDLPCGITEMDFLTVEECKQFLAP